MVKMLVENMMQMRDYAPVLQPVQGPDPDDTKDVEQEALDLRAELNRANRDQTRELLSKLKSLSGRIPMHGRRGRRSASIVQAAITSAERQLEALSDEQACRVESDDARRMLELGLYLAMSKPAKQFYDAIEIKKTYKIAPVTEGGVVSVGAKKEVDGEELRKEFSLIKYHSMSETEKKDVLTRAWRLDDSEGVVSNNPEFLTRERDALAQLHRSLRHMQAYKAFKDISGARGHVKHTMVEISRDHDDFIRAHAQVDALLWAYSQLIERPHDEAAIAQFRLERGKLRRILKEDIMDRVLLDATTTDGLAPRHHEAGLPLSPLPTPIIGAAKGLMGEPP